MSTEDGIPLLYITGNFLLSLWWVIRNWHRGEVYREDPGVFIFLILWLGSVSAWFFALIGMARWVTSRWRGWMDRIAPR